MSAPLEIIALGAGGLIMIGVIAWRVRARRRPVVMLRRALLNPDVATRRAAVSIAAERGLRPYVQVFAERTRNETDPSVLDAMAEAVARNQWEPANTPALLQLRLWAQSRALHTAPVDRAAAAPAPATAAATAATATAKAGEPVLDWFPDDAPARTNGNGHHPAPVPVSAPARQSERGKTALLTKSRSRGMPATVRVIVTGAGGAAGVAVVRALQRAGHEVIAVDPDGLAAGIRLASQGTMVPRADDQAFGAALRELCVETAANALISTVAEELPALIDIRDGLAASGVATWLPTAAAVEACLDKWQFARIAAAKGIRVPATNLGSANGVPGSWVVKPRRGRGSRDVHYVDRHVDLAWVLQHVPEPIVQTRLSGREFTVDALVDRRGKLVGAVPRWRMDVKAGICVKGRTFEDATLLAAVAELLSAIGLTGPCNVQGFLAADGAPTFVEVNPRFSGGLPLSLAAGADFVGEYLRAIFGESIRADRLHYRPGLTMIRHYEELFE